jgi:hypothetical protein
MSIPYRFMPWVRKGLARAHQNPDKPGESLKQDQVKVALTLQAKENGKEGETKVVSGTINLKLYGPGDIIGIDPRLVVRTDPRPNTRNFEPNYLATIDFDPPDFPWLLTPAKADGQNLRPWLVLVVLDRSVVKALPKVKPGQALPSITLSPEQVGSELPKLNESYLWAHAQAVSENSNPNELIAELAQKPASNISRLICPRRLKERHDYIACVVPAFKPGLLRGIGSPVPENMPLSPAWSDQGIELPIYYHWEFSTGPAGDIEALARRLRTPRHYEDDKDLMAKLNNIGTQTVAVDADRLLYDGNSPGSTVFEGAFLGLDFEPAPANPVFTDKLATILNSGQNLVNTGQPKADQVPTLSPPVYGQYPANRHTVVPNSINGHWLDQLNLQPRYRLVAGWGAEIVRQSQDEFMQAAWKQMSTVLATERALSLSRFSRDVLKSIEKRHLSKLPEHRLLAVINPARGRILLEKDHTLYGRIDTATMPTELFDGAMRRLTSSQRACFKMAQFRARSDRSSAVYTNTTVESMKTLVNHFANPEQNFSLIDPHQFTPAQSISSAAMIPQPGDIYTHGLLTEVHQRGLMALQQASGQSLPTDLTTLTGLIGQLSSSNVHSVQLSVSNNNEVVAQAMELDTTATLQTTTLKLSGSPLTAILTSPIQSPSLPVGATPTVLANVTMPAVIKDPAILDRYSSAFKAYQQLYVDPQDEAQVFTRLHSLDVSGSASLVRRQMDPARSVPARLASQLSALGEPALWNPEQGLSHKLISSRFDKNLTGQHYLIPKTFDRVMAFPHLKLPLSRKLAQMAPQVFLPGVGHIPDDSIMAVKANPRFVEALMLGANHEMARELLWQGFPTDQRGTPFQHFWQRHDGRFDIAEIHQWERVVLGKQEASTEMLVLLIRGQLLELFPDLSIYACRITPDNKLPEKLEPIQIKKPIISGHLGKDINYVGFDMLPKDMHDYFFILEEHLTEPRFGFDETATMPLLNKPSGWQDVHWDKLQVAPNDYFSGSKLIAGGMPAIKQPMNAAIVASALLQRPFRGYYAGAKLKPKSV